MGPGMVLELSMRDPTVQISPREPAWPGAEGLAASAGCEASAKQTTTAAVKAHLMTRIYFPFQFRAGRSAATPCATTGLPRK